MANDLNRSIKILIDGSQATSSVEKLESTIAKLESKLASLNRSEANYDKRSKQLQAELGRKNKTLQDYKTKLAGTDRVLKNLSGATYNELIAVQKIVRDEFRRATPGTRQYTAALEQNRRVSESLTRAQAAMRVEVGCQATAWGKAANFVNKYMGLISGFLASVTGISMTMRKSVNDYAQISEAMAGVKKYTGMADEEIKALNEDFKKMDTRTPRERLNELAQDAGRLGIQGRKDILDFVDAANIINVALGEDLGEDAVKNIGKLAQMFGDDKELGLRGAMLATASAVNEVAQNSSAAEPYLVAFTARVAGTAKQAGISQTAILGYASALDQDMQQLEMSGTALQQVMMKIYQQPAVFAKMAGKDVKEFTKLIKTDANEAILQLLESIRNMGGLSETAPLFKEMKLDGVRAAGVLNTLAGSIDKVRAEQKRASDAYRDGTSVIKEFDVQNNTVQAGLEKAKKKFQEIVYEMGEILAPSMGKLIVSSGDLIRVLASVIKILADNQRSVIHVIAALTAYAVGTRLSILLTKLSTAETIKQTIALNASIAVTKAKRLMLLAYAAAYHLLSGNIKSASKAMLLFNGASKANLIGLVLAAVTALGYGIYRLATRTTEAQKRIKTFYEELEKEQRELRKLTDAAMAAGDGTKRRKELIEEINTRYGQYLPNLLTEYSTLKDIEQAYKDINKVMEKNIAKKVMDEQTDEVRTEGLKKQSEELLSVRQKLEEVLPESQIAHVLGQITKNTQKAIEEGGSGVEATTNALIQRLSEGYIKNNYWLKSNLKGTLEDYVQEVYETNNKVKDIQKEFAPFVQKDKPTVKPANQLDEVVVESTRKSSTGSGVEEDDKVRRAKLQAEKADYARKQAELKDMYASGNSEIIKSEKDFNKAMEDLQLKHLQRSIEIAGEKSNEAADFQNQIADIKLRQKGAAIQEALEAEKQLYVRQQDELKALYISQQDENLRSEAQYNDALEQLTIMHLQRTLEIAGLNADERAKIERQLTDIKLKCLKDEENERKKRDEADQQRKDELKKREQHRLQQQAEQYRQYGEAIGDTLGMLITNQEDALQSFADTMIDILFDVLSQMIEIEIMKATGVATGAVARSTAEAMAMPDSVATFGASGVARAAVLSGLIMGALAAAKSALKGMIKRGKSSGSSSDESEGSKRATVKVSQWATGRYDVIGEDDGKTYRNIPYLGPAPTGIVQRTSLVSENGAELIVNAEDLQRLQRHMNYPLVLQAITDARNNQVPQRASGNYKPIETDYQYFPNLPLTTNIEFMFTHLLKVLENLRYIKAFVTLRDIEEIREQDRKSKEPFTRKKS